MQGRRIAAGWPLAGFVIALATIAIALVFVTRTDGESTASLAAVQRARHESQALAAAIERSSQTSHAPSLIEALRAADAFVRAATTPSSPAPPTLKEILESADAIAKAAGAEPAPTLEESLIAADELVRAGAIEPPPTLEQVLVAADRLRIAGVLPEQPAPPQPTLRESMLAADAIRIASESQQQALAAPPQAPIELAPTSTPVPPPPAPVPTSTPAPPPTVAAPVAPQTSSSSGFWDAAFGAQVLTLVNQRRASAGLGPVTPESRLEQSARDYAKVLADNNWFSHTGPDGSTLVTRVTATGFPFDVQIGEVLAWGSDHWQPAEIVQAWIDSPGHREQLLGPYSRAGVGCYFTDAGSTVRCVIDFAG